MSSDTEIRCPLLIWAVVYVGSIAGGDALLRLAADATGAPWLAYPATVSLAAVCVSSSALEILIGCGWMCDSVQRPSGRLAVYALAFMVGIFVWSGMTVGHNVPLWYRAVVIALFILPLLALAAAHSTHRFSKSLRLVARLPVIVLLMIIATLLFFAITNHTITNHM
jgi:hypothetical protein